MSSSSSLLPFSIDLPNYIARYSGEARLQRLLLLQDYFARNASGTSHSTNNPTGSYHSQQELVQNFLQQHLIDSKNTHHPMGRGASDATATTSGQLDDAWCRQTRNQNQRHRHILMQRLQAAQSQLQKDAIRQAYVALAQFDLQTGELHDAFQAVLRAKDYCLHYTQNIQVTMLLIEIAIHRQHYNIVHDFAAKLSNTVANTSTNAMGRVPNDGISEELSLYVVQARIQTAQALEKLSRKHFKPAATHFRGALDILSKHVISGDSSSSSQNVQVDSTSSPQFWKSLISVEEVAMASVVLTLAYGSPEEMQSLTNIEILESLLPTPLRETIRDLGHHHCHNHLPFRHILACENDKQQDTSSTRWKLSQAIKLEYFLSPHDEKIMQEISQKSIQLYWQAYSRIPLHVMEKELQLPPSECTLVGGDDIMTSGDQQGVDDDSHPSSDLVSSEDVLATRLAKLIDQGVLPDTRLNKPAGILEREVGDSSRLSELRVREQLFNQSQTVLNESHASLIRMVCIEKKIYLRHSGTNNRSSRQSGDAEEKEDVSGRNILMDSDTEMEDGGIPTDEAMVMNPEDTM